jgi:hypothetical protein
MERYYSLSEDVLEVLNTYVSKFLATTVRLNIVFIGDSKLKKLIKIKKYNDEDRFITGNDIKIIINESIWDLIEKDDQKAVEVLIKEEFDAISVNLETGKIKVDKPRFNTNKNLIEKYGYDIVSRAKELEELALSQAEDKANDAEVDISI